MEVTCLKKTIIAGCCKAIRISRNSMSGSSIRSSWSFVLLLMLISMATHSVNGLGGKMDGVKRRACEDDSLALLCPGSEVIEIMKAEYGRDNQVTCSSRPEQMRNTDCSLKDALRITTEKCNNQTSCKLTVTQETFPDPCPGTHKYLSVTYKCLKFMFGCPGLLMGFGARETLNISFYPQPGVWTKDPLYNIDHVYYLSSSQQSIQVYFLDVSTHAV